MSNNSKTQLVNVVLSAEAFAKKATEDLKDTDGDRCKYCKKMASNLVCLVNNQCYECYLEGMAIEPGKFINPEWDPRDVVAGRTIEPRKWKNATAPRPTIKVPEQTMNKNKKVSGNATNNSSLVTIACFVVPVSLGTIIAAVIYNQYGHTMQAAEAISSAKYWLKFGALASVVLGTISAAIEFATKGVK